MFNLNLNKGLWYLFLQISIPGVMLKLCRKEIQPLPVRASMMRKEKLKGKNGFSTRVERLIDPPCSFFATGFLQKPPTDLQKFHSCGSERRHRVHPGADHHSVSRPTYEWASLVVMRLVFPTQELPEHFQWSQDEQSIVELDFWGRNT